jgi:hypothetical protein
MIIKLVSNGRAVVHDDMHLGLALLQFIEASKDIMHDDIRHKPLLEAFNNAVKVFSNLGFDVILVDEEV